MKPVSRSVLAAAVVIFAPSSAVIAQMVRAGVLVNAGGPDTQNAEPALATSPTNSEELVVAWHFHGAPGRVHWAASINAGATFARSAFMQAPGPCGASVASDPMACAARGSSGEVWIGALMCSTGDALPTMQNPRYTPGAASLTNYAQVALCGSISRTARSRGRPRT
jgi:hypothetical protein